MPSISKTLVFLAVAAHGFLAPAPQRPATLMQAATIAAKDVSALRKASGPDPVQKCIKRRLQAGRARTRVALRPCVARKEGIDAIAATYKNTQHETQAPA